MPPTDLLVVGVDAPFIFGGEVEGDEGGRPKRLCVAECIDALAVLRARVLWLGLLLTIVRSDPRGDICRFVGFHDADDGLEVKESEGRRMMGRR